MFTWRIEIVHVDTEKPFLYGKGDWRNAFAWRCSVTQLCLTLQPQGWQHAMLPCPSLSPRVCSDSCPLS